MYQLHYQVNICHRDIKPDNLLFYEKRWKISDFGTVKEFHYDALYEAGNVAGTVNYFSPEVRNVWDSWKKVFKGESKTQNKFPMSKED